MAKLKFVAYCGMSSIPWEGSNEECLEKMKERLALREKQGFIVEKIGENTYEIQQDDDAVMISDFEGTMWVELDSEEAYEDMEEEDGDL